MVPRRRPSIDTVAPAAAFLVRRSLTQTADLPAPSMENVATSVTWSTAWRGTPPQVSVTRYQPTGRRFGSWIHEKPSSTVRILRLALATRGRPAIGTGAMVETRVHSGAVSIAFQASIAAAMPDRWWTVTGIEVGPRCASGMSIHRLIAALSRGVASTNVLLRPTVTVERAVAAVSNRTTTSCARTWPVPASGSPWPTVTV